MQRELKGFFFDIKCIVFLVRSPTPELPIQKQTWPKVSASAPSPVPKGGSVGPKPLAGLPAPTSPVVQGIVGQPPPVVRGSPLPIRKEPTTRVPRWVEPGSSEESGRETPVEQNVRDSDAEIAHGDDKSTEPEDQWDLPGINFGEVLVRGTGLTGCFWIDQP